LVDPRKRILTYIKNNIIIIRVDERGLWKGFGSDHRLKFEGSLQRKTPTQQCRVLT